jgi:hypothetical protein
LPAAFEAAARFPFPGRPASTTNQDVVSLEVYVICSVRTVIGLFAVVWFGSGCGSNAPPPTADGKLPVAGANSRIKYKDEYKQMLGKDGKMIYKPSESKKRPQGSP